MYGEDEGVSRRRRNAVLGVCLTLLGPPIVLIAYFLMFASRTMVTDYGALAMAAIVGVAGIGILPIPNWARLLLATGLVILIALNGPYLAVGFACAVKGLCL